MFRTIRLRIDVVKSSGAEGLVALEAGEALPVPSAPERGFVAWPEQAVATRAEQAFRAAVVRFAVGPVVVAVVSFWKRLAACCADKAVAVPFLVHRARYLVLY
eukprot:TRINITY_DN11790_c0_g1_i1.p3 TRINITY_DN11790_c0_g1~~TRINITY_DN11790_c0_g1_i1.p3  ORF type:complete len:103 (+),score=5.10 TRINITY_DN11790_c0_g1_i1:185-493(+)